MLQTLLLFMKSLNKTETPIFYPYYVLCFQRQSLFTFIVSVIMISSVQVLILFIGQL